MDFLRFPILAVAGALHLAGCQRDFDSPFLPDSGSYAGSAWARDADGDGVADSVAKYAPGCGDAPTECLKKAQANAGLGTLLSVAAEDMTLLAGGHPASPRVEWQPAAAPGVLWELASDDSTVARPQGRLVHPLSPGATVLTVSARAGNGPVRTARFKVTVASTRVPVLSVAGADLELAPGETRAPEVEIRPPDATDARYELITHDPRIVRISQGMLVGGEAGQARVTARALDGGHQAIFTVTVRRRIAGVSAQPLTLTAGGPPVPPLIEFNPPDATNKDWHLSGGLLGVAVTTVDGMVKPVGPGAAKFTVTVEGGLSAEFSVTVVAAHVPVRSIRVEDMHFATFAGPDGRVRDPEVTWTPADASDKAYTLTVENPSIARVVGASIEALRTGETKATLTTRDGLKRDTFKIKITALICGGVLGPCDSDKPDDD